MDSIAVVHMDLMAKGGGESVCMNVLEALQDEYDVTLMTLTEPDFDVLNDYFNTDVRSVAVERPGFPATALHDHFGLRYYVLQNALLGRYARRQADRFDRFVSTINELGLPDEALEYVHFPFDWTVSLDDELRERIFHPTIEEDGVYERLCTAVAGITTDTVGDSRLLANSEWTASAVRDAYRTEPDVVYPPVDTSQFVDRPWSDRERGFVTIGRIERSKRIDELIEIVDGVRERGHDVHLHVIGPTIDSEYCEEVAEMATSRSYIELDGEVSRETLVDRVCAHRYGLHGKRHEHFGMSVAELVAGGTIPFVPASGGQTDIVDDSEALLYSSTAEAVEKIDRVLSSPSRQANLRISPETIREQYGRERFRERIRSLVGDGLETEAKRAQPPIATGR